MYFESDKMLDKEKLKTGEEIFFKLTDDEKNNYINELFFFIRQQVFYAGLDSLLVCKFFKKLADDEKFRIMEKIGYEDDKDTHVITKTCSKSEMADIFGRLSKLKDLCEEGEANEKDSNLN